MNPAIHRIVAPILAGFGLLTAMGYGLAVALSDSRREAAEEWGTLAGFGLLALFAGTFWFLAATRLSRSAESGSRLPPVWLSFSLFVLLVGVGFAIAFLDRVSYLAPLLGALAFAMVTAFFLRIAARWFPDRRLPLGPVVLPAIWGAFISPIILIVIQGAAVALIGVSLFAGVFVNDPDFEFDPDLEERITSYFEDSESNATSTTLPPIVEAQSIALALFSVVAIIAPISEELVKAAGAIFVLSRFAVVSRGDAFLAAVASGLGFAVFEGIGYTLAAPSAWHQIILIRAPVVIMHVAATTIIVMGWYRARTTGRGFIPYFVIGTALHAGWNALSVAVIYSLSGIEEGADPTAGQALSISSVVLLLGGLFITAVAWFVIQSRDAGLSEPRTTLASETYDRTPTQMTAYANNG